MELAITRDWMYLVFTIIGLLGYWLNIIERERQKAKKVGRYFDRSDYMWDQFTQIIISVLLTITGNVIFVEHADQQMRRAIIYAVVAGLSWSGGSLTKYAIEVFPGVVKKFIDKWKS